MTNLGCNSHEFPLPAHKLTHMFTTGDTTPVEITTSILERIQQLEKHLNCIINLNKNAISDAQKAYLRYKGNGSPPTRLTGVPVLLKDNISTSDITTTAGSNILRSYVPPYDATVVKRLRDAGAVIIGKANMDEFAMGSSNETSAFGTVSNPWNLECVPGGSSGGSAAAVAAGECIVALGSDTGGSIRQPASFCGVTGMKPTYGLVSRYGLIAFASSFDQIGPIGQDALDCASTLQTIWGTDPKDSTSVNMNAGKLDLYDYLTSYNQNGVKGLRIGVPRAYFTKYAQSGVLSAFNLALGALENLGAEIEEVRLPTADYAYAVYYIIASCEASSNLARYDGVKYGLALNVGKNVREMTKETRGSGFGEEVKRRILLGTYALSAGYYDAWYKKALEVSYIIKTEFEELFKKVDIIVMPTSPTVAFKLGEHINSPRAMYNSDIYTMHVNIAQLPAVSLPCGFYNGLPVGLQMVANKLHDHIALRAAWAYQQVSEWHKTHPKISTSVAKKV